MSSDNNINNNSGNQTPRFNKLDNLKNNIAAKAATAAGGPMAGKAVETLNKIRNNPNNNGYANNKRNRLGQAGNTSNDNSSGLDENSSNGTTNTSNKSSNSPINKLGSMLGGNSNKINENDSTVTKAVKTAKKIRRAMPIIAALAPFIISFLGLIIVVVIVMSQFAAIENFVAQIQVGVEKMLNFATGEGWTTNENVFFKKLETENKKYKLLSSNGESLDIPLVAATIHYDRLVDINAYEKNNIENEQYNDEQQDTAIVKKEQTASFYGVAGDMLGKVDTIKPGERKLLGHLVKTEITYTEFSANDIKGAGEAWLNYFNQAGVSISKDVCVPGNIICYYQQYLEYVKNTRNYAKQYDDILAYTKFEDLNVFYEAKEFIDAFNKSEDEKDKTSGLFVPKVTRTMDYETYKDYLRNVYIPYHYFYGAKKEDINPLDIENIIDEIFAQKDYYNYLFHNENKENSSLAGGVCNYTVNGVTASDIKVELLSCDSTKDHQTVYETVDFDKYIMGVVYAEIDFDEKYSEAMKAQAVAARSFALTRANEMCPSNSSNCFVGFNPSTKTIRIRTCEADQVYCDYEKGCTHTSVNGFLETKSGTNSGGKLYKSALSQEKIEKYSAILSEVNGKVATNTNGNIKYTSYTDNEQKIWKELNSQGKDYNEMLVKTYGNVSIKSDCSTGGAKAGPWADWKQGGSPWSGIRIGSVTVGTHGCLLTSLAIQMARTETVGADFNPGVFVNRIKQFNGIGRGGGFDRPSSLIAAYPQVSTIKLIKGQKVNNLNDIAKALKNYINNGYYVVLRVKYDYVDGKERMHWVAVVDVDNNNNIIIVDPAYTGQKGTHILNEKYCNSHDYYNVCWHKTINFYYFKVK